ncbi:unnamed protein product [Eruca vesicaria subsp. sativa]|uniref:Uncharacterized protein n=1 Tax=Eruca vesicaria subsp. sativa TaxID=29727 RepID=A0ABC8JC97_ERUVS|nr:unnamed protein product [Eruca vesicaria subsp. sativa]
MAEPGGPDWTNEWGAPVFMRYEPGSEPEEKCHFLPCIRRREDEGPFLTPEEEQRRFEEQVESSKGFDINFEEFRCIFNYVPVDFDENYYFKDTDTTRGVIKRLLEIPLSDTIKQRVKVLNLLRLSKPILTRPVLLPSCFTLPLELRSLQMISQNTSKLWSAISVMTPTSITPAS